MELRCTLLSAVGLIAFSLSAHGGEPNPESKRTPWRIPSNQAVTAVGNEIDWRLLKHKNGLVVLEAAIGEHHSYEQAWAHYAKMLGMDSNYNARTKQQRKIVEGDRRWLREHDRDHIFKAGRWTVMDGKVGKYRMQLSLFNEPQKPESKDRVYVKLTFNPNR
jgi:hypothetical protein